MRLIDADAMLKRNEQSIYDTSDLKEMLDNEPTAYDVENIVQKIRELDSCDSCYSHGREDCSWCTVKERIDIILNNK